VLLSPALYFRPLLLEFSPEGAVLEGGEKGVEFGERGSMQGLHLIDGNDPT
jgi:hypothetical protein